jgi:salicylate hydroxylase
LWHRYEHLDSVGKSFQDAKAKNPGQTFEESLEVKIKGFGGTETLGWIYQNDIQKVWEEFLSAENSL